MKKKFNWLEITILMCIKNRRPVFLRELKRLLTGFDARTGKWKEK